MATQQNEINNSRLSHLNKWIHISIKNREIQINYGWLDFIVTIMAIKSPEIVDFGMLILDTIFGF